jgi:alkylhydroperoxidase family enzyme
MTASEPRASTRLPLVEMPEDSLAREQFEKLAAGRGILNLHRTMAHAPTLMKISGDMAVAFRRDTALARALVELVIMRTAQVVNSDYVFARHLPLARAHGVTEPQIAELDRWRDSDAFTPAEKSALDFSEKAAEETTIGDAAFATLRQHFSPREIVEMTMLVGHYVATAIIIRSLDVPDETD